MKEKLIFKRIVFVFVIFIFEILEVNAASNPYKKTSSYGTNCTWYAWQQAYDKAGVALPGWGNANTWFDSAKKAGYETGTTPRAKSIVVWKWSSYGHVGYVEKVSNGKIYAWDSEGPCIDSEDEKTCFNNSIDESSYNECIKKAKTVACEYDATYWSEPGDLIGYIYLDKAPTKPTTPPNINQNQNTGTTNTPVKKSNNANLSIVKISNIDFEFKKDILKYELEVDGEVESVKVEAKTENNKAKVVGAKEYKLKVGNNTIELVVTAEDNTKKTYNIEIKRKDNNTNLKELNISNINFEFDKETLEYSFNVNSNVEKINIEASTESEVATLEGIGEHTLNYGENIINIKVIAEDNTEKVYTIKINKERKEEKQETKNISKSQSNNNLIIYISSGLIALIIIGLLITFVIKKKVKKKK